MDFRLYETAKCSHTRVYTSIVQVCKGWHQKHTQHVCYPERCSWLTPPTFFMVFACLSSNVWCLYDYLFFVHKYSHSFFLQILYNKVIFRNNLDLQRNTKQFCCKVHFMLKIHICTPRVAIIFSRSKGLFMGFFV